MVKLDIKLNAFLKDELKTLDRCEEDGGGGNQPVVNCRNKTPSPYGAEATC